MESDTNIKQ